MKTADEQQAEDDAAMTDDELIAELVETTSFVGKVRPWQDVPETGADPDDEPAAVLAEQLARIAHAGQVDKQGLPYIEHVARVAASVVTDVCATVPDTGSTAVAAAWLHDVLEDTPTTAADLLAAGIPG